MDRFGKEGRTQGGRSIQVDYILWRGCKLKEFGDYKLVSRDNVARQHWLVVCRISLVLRKRKRAR